MNLVLSDCLSAFKIVLTKAGISPDYVEKYTQQFMNELGKQYMESQSKKNTIWTGGVCSIHGHFNFDPFIASEEPPMCPRCGVSKL